MQSVFIFFSFVFLRVFCLLWSGHINWDSIKTAFLPHKTATCLSRARSKWIVMQWSGSYCSTCSTFSFWWPEHLSFYRLLFLLFLDLMQSPAFVSGFVLMRFDFNFRKIFVYRHKSSRSFGNELIHFSATLSLIIRRIAFKDFSLFNH